MHLLLEKRACDGRVPGQKDIEAKELEHLQTLKEIRAQAQKKAKKIALYTCSYCHQKGHRKPQCHKQLKDTYVKLGLTQKEMARRLPVGSASFSTINKEPNDSGLDNTDTTNTARSTIETLGVAGTTATKAGDPQTSAAPAAGLQSPNLPPQGLSELAGSQSFGVSSQNAGHSPTDWPKIFNPSLSPQPSTLAPPPTPLPASPPPLQLQDDIDAFQYETDPEEIHNALFNPIDYSNIKQEPETPLSEISNGLFNDEEAKRFHRTYGKVKKGLAGPVSRYIKPGMTQHHNVKCDSRHPSMVDDSELNTVTNPLPRHFIIPITQIDDEWLPNLQEAYSKCKESAGQIFRAKEFPNDTTGYKVVYNSEKETTVRSILKVNTTDDGQQSLTLCIPKECRRNIKGKDMELREAIIKNAHELLGHPAVRKTYEYVKEYFYWIGMFLDVKDYVEQCDSCQRTKNNTQRPQGLAKPLTIPNQIFSHLSMDFISLPPKIRKEHGTEVLYDKVWMIVESLSGLKELIEIAKGTTANDLIDLFNRRIVPHWGYSDDIVSDQDPLL